MILMQAKVDEEDRVMEIVGMLSLSSKTTIDQLSSRAISAIDERDESEGGLNCLNRTLDLHAK